MSSQQKLFDTQPAPWEVDDQSEQLIATVILTSGPAKPLDYSVPEGLRPRLEVGRRIRAPLGSSQRLATGYCVALDFRQIGPRRLKPLHSVLDDRSLLSPAMLRLTQWMADYYLCPWSQVLDAVLPAGVRSKAGTRKATLLCVAAGALSRLGELKLSPKQLHVMRCLAGVSEPVTPAQLAKAAKCTQAPIDALRKKGLIQAHTARVSAAAPADAAESIEESLVLNAEQQIALDAILNSLRAPRHETILIHGVTGSGKTEVYIRAIEEVIGYGRQAIVLVPEISLTPQTQQRFRARFDRVAVLHSHLSDAQRHQQWQQIAAGEVQVIVGARSAVFAPTPHLGLIVLDEEHETSFKQETAPRYHARDVALERARAEGVPLVLGSATPSLESWYRAQTGEYRLVDMPRRVLNRPLPGVAAIDLRNEFRDRRSRGAVSRPLHQAIAAALADKGQVILLLNRRGFSTHIQCPACGLALRCPHCDIALTHHRREEIALCHYCDYQEPAPTECPSCHYLGIHYGGLGTQRLEAEIRARFPDHVCLRMDTDTMQGPGSHERALAAFRSGKVHILLGTQMIAKGLDFPNVTLVGVVNADLALHLPDFRAAEKTFQLVTQVAGRTGRGPRGGRVLVQTFTPDHPAIQCALRHDYETFAKQELPVRQELRYPPYSTMVRLVVRGPSEPVASGLAAHLGTRLRAAVDRHCATTRVLGPAPAPIARLRGMYRFQLQAQGPDGEALRAAVREATNDLNPPTDVQWTVDVDPLDML